MSKHTIIGDHEATVSGNCEDGAYVTFAITYNFIKGSPARGPSYASGGELADPDEVELISVKLLDGDGIEPTQAQLEEWAEDWLQGGGYGLACSNAREDNQCARDDARQARYDAMRDARRED